MARNMRTLRAIRVSVTGGRYGARRRATCGIGPVVVDAGIAGFSLRKACLQSEHTSLDSPKVKEASGCPQRMQLAIRIPCSREIVYRRMCGEDICPPGRHLVPRARTFNKIALCYGK